MTISFLSISGKLPSHCLIDEKLIFEILLREMAIKRLDCQLKLMAFVMVYVKIVARGNVPN